MRSVLARFPLVQDALEEDAWQKRSQTALVVAEQMMRTVAESPGCDSVDEEKSSHDGGSGHLGEEELEPGDDVADAVTTRTGNTTTVRLQRSAAGGGFGIAIDRTGTVTGFSEVRGNLIGHARNNI